MKAARVHRGIFSNPDLAYRCYLVLEATRAYNGIIGSPVEVPMARALVTVFTFKATLHRLRAS